MNTEVFPSVARLAQEPIGFFLRPQLNDHTVASQLFSEGYTQVSGVIFDPTQTDYQDKLRQDTNIRKLWTVLDPRCLELSFPGGFTGKRALLPWAGENVHTAESLKGLGGAGLVEKLVHHVGQHGYSAILAPAHFLERGADDAWFAVDRQLLVTLRTQLDRAGLDRVAIYYPLATTQRNFFLPDSRGKLKAGLTGLPINSIFLRIENFGSHTSAAALQKYIRACQDFHSLKNCALIAEKAGVAGHALTAFGAASGVECGISFGEEFQVGTLKKAPDPEKKSFGAHRHVYLPQLGTFLSPKEAETFFANRQMRAKFGCTDRNCCRDGIGDLIKNTRRHYVVTRLKEADELSHVPASLRAQSYLDKFLRPATDQTARAIQASIPENLQKKFERSRKQLDGWRATLGQMAQFEQPSVAPVVERYMRRLEMGA